MLKRHAKLIVFLIILVILAVCGVIFVPKFFKNSNEGKAQVPQISTVQLTRMDLTDSVSATGTIESSSTVTVSADVANVTVKKVLVEIGDTVIKGQELVTFDKSELKQAVKEAETEYSDTVSQTSSELSQAYQQLSNARSNYASDKARLEKVVREAEKALKKAKKRAKKNAGASAKADPGNGNGFDSAGPGNDIGSDPGTGSAGNGSSGESGGVSQGSDVVISDNMTVAEAEAALKQAKENLESANRQNLQSIKQAQQSVTQVQNNNKRTLRQAKQSVQNAKDTLKSAAINATMDGTVTALGVEAGSVYNGGDAVEISDLTQFQVVTTVDEYDITKIEKGQRVVILTDATGDTEIEGEITFVAPTTGSTTLNSGSSVGNGNMAGSSMGGNSSSTSGYEIKIALKGTDAKIRSGMTAKCSIVINEAADVFAVPYDAIHTNDNNEDVIYVMDSSGRKEVVVNKGMESDYYVEVSSDGLSDGMSVIIPTDATTSSDSSGDSDNGGFDLFGGGPGGDFPGGGFSGSGGPPSGFSGGGGSFPGAPPG
ncbi:MAG: efflux RND transporter periplasmic adaptor subunit [Eubacterium sp.]|nr:efflux RND transporter periplasmic adaptor subunit [Eubacterium sp.]